MQCHLSLKQSPGGRYSPIYSWENWGLERWCDLPKVSRAAGARRRSWTEPASLGDVADMLPGAQKRPWGPFSGEKQQPLTSPSISLLPSHFYFLSLSQVWLNLHLMNPTLSFKGCWSNKTWQGVSDDAISCAGSRGQAVARSPEPSLHTPWSGGCTQLRRWGSIWWLPARSGTGWCRVELFYFRWELELAFGITMGQQGWGWGFERCERWRGGCGMLCALGQAMPPHWSSVSPAVKWGSGPWFCCLVDCWPEAQSLMGISKVAVWQQNKLPGSPSHVLVLARDKGAAPPSAVCKAYVRAPGEEGG